MFVRELDSVNVVSKYSSRQPQRLLYTATCPQLHQYELPCLPRSCVAALCALRSIHCHGKSNTSLAVLRVRAHSRSPTSPCCLSGPASCNAAFSIPGGTDCGRGEAQNLNVCLLEGGAGPEFRSCICIEEAVNACMVHRERGQRNAHLQEALFSQRSTTTLSNGVHCCTAERCTAEVRSPFSVRCVIRTWKDTVSPLRTV